MIGWLQTVQGPHISDDTACLYWKPMLSRENSCWLSCLYYEAQWAGIETDWPQITGAGPPTENTSVGYHGTTPALMERRPYILGEHWNSEKADPLGKPQSPFPRLYFCLYFLATPHQHPDISVPTEDHFPWSPRVNGAAISSLLLSFLAHTANIHARVC